jgi:hypothetical protein
MLLFIQFTSVVTVSPLLTTVGYRRFFDQIPRGYGRCTVFPITAHEALPSDTFRQCMHVTLASYASSSVDEQLTVELRKGKQISDRSLYLYGLQNMSAGLGNTYVYVNFTAGKPSAKLLLQTAVTYGRLRFFAKNRGYSYGTVPVTALQFTIAL